MFYWRIIALQYYAGFCHTSAWISHRYTHIPFLSCPTPSHSSRLFQSPGLSFLSHTEIQNYGTLYKSACHPCTGAVLIFSASFQFYHVCCQSTPLNSFSSKSEFSPRLTQLPFSQGPHLPLTKHSLWPRCWGQHLLFVVRDLTFSFNKPGNSLVVQWLGFLALPGKGPGSIPGGGTKIPQAEWHDQPNNKQKHKSVRRCSSHPNSMGEETEALRERSHSW